jgi:CRISPR/Cas system endoribonuclease Cas6 (RAMP superfamily)
MWTKISLKRIGQTPFNHNLSLVGNVYDHTKRTNYCLAYSTNRSIDKFFALQILDRKICKNDILSNTGRHFFIFPSGIWEKNDIEFNIARVMRNGLD